MRSQAFRALVENWARGKAVESLLKDCEALLAFSDFPAGHLEISAHEQRHRSSRETTAYLD